MEDRQSRCTLYNVGVLGEGKISNGAENIFAAITEESFSVITECPEYEPGKSNEKNWYGMKT